MVGGRNRLATTLKKKRDQELKLIAKDARDDLHVLRVDVNSIASYGLDVDKPYLGTST